MIGIEWIDFERLKRLSLIKINPNHDRIVKWVWNSNRDILMHTICDTSCENAKIKGDQNIWSDDSWVEDWNSQFIQSINQSIAYKLKGIKMNKIGDIIKVIEILLSLKSKLLVNWINWIDSSWMHQ